MHIALEKAQNVINNLILNINLFFLIGKDPQEKQKKNIPGVAKYCPEIAEK